MLFISYIYNSTYILNIWHKIGFFFNENNFICPTNLNSEAILT